MDFRNDLLDIIMDYSDSYIQNYKVAENYEWSKHYSSYWKKYTFAVIMGLQLCSTYDVIRGKNHILQEYISHFGIIFKVGGK